MTKEESIQGAIDEVLKDAGALHGMVCNAGRTKHKPALDFTTEEIDQLWGVNVSRFFEGYKGNLTSSVAVREFLLCTMRGARVYKAKR